MVILEDTKFYNSKRRYINFDMPSFAIYFSLYIQIIVLQVLCIFLRCISPVNTVPYLLLLRKQRHVVAAGHGNKSIELGYSE